VLWTSKRKRIEIETRARKPDVLGNLYDRDCHLTSGGEIIRIRLTPEIFAKMSGSASTIALRQALLMKTIGAKYMPRDAVGYSYGVTALGYEGWADPRAKVEELWNAQKWNAYGVVWVEYADFGATVSGDVGVTLLKLADEVEGNLTKLAGLPSDIRAISECGVGTYFSYCDYVDKLSKADKALLYSTLKMLKSSVGVFGKEAKPSWGKVAVYTEDGGSVRVEEREAAAKASPIYDGYLAMPYMPVNPKGELEKRVNVKMSGERILNTILEGAKLPEGQYVNEAKKALWSVLDKVLPGWITVAGVNVFFEPMDKAVIRAIADGARVLKTIDKGKPVSEVARAVASIGGLEKLSKQVLSRLDEATAGGRTVSEEEIVELVRSYSGGEEVVKLVKALSEATGLSLSDRRLWETASRLDKPVGNDVEVLAKAFSRVAGDEEIGELFAAAHAVLDGGVDPWTLASSLFSEKRKEAIKPYLVLKVGEELVAKFNMEYLHLYTRRSVGVKLGKIYENCFGSKGAQLAKLYRGLGIVVPMLYINNPEKREEIVELVLDPSKKLDELMLYSSFYSFGVPTSKMFKVLGHYEAFIPLALFLSYGELGKSMELKLYRSEGGRVVEETAIVGGLTDFFKAVDEAVLGYIEQVKKWGVKLTEASVYQGLLYMFSSRRLEGEEKLDDMFPTMIDILTGYAKATARFIVELEKDLRRLDKLNARVSEAMGRVDEGKLAEWVEKKYSKIREELEVYRRSVEDLRKTLLSAVQYLHPQYMSNLTDASRATYELLMEFENLHNVGVRVDRVVEWLKKKEEAKELKEAWEEFYEILESWHSAYISSLASLPPEILSSLPININSNSSLLNTLPVIVALYNAIEDARRFREKVLAALIAMEEEIRKEEEEKKKKQQQQQQIQEQPPPSQQPPTTQQPPPQQKQEQPPPTTQDKTTDTTTKKEDKTTDTTTKKEEDKAKTTEQEAYREGEEGSSQ